MIKKFIKVLFLLILTSILLIVVSDFVISKQSKNCYSSLSEVAPAKVGMVLGTSKHVRSGNINQYYQFRVDATAELFKAGKIKYVLVSGDNSTKEYDEPQDFKEDLIKMGIPQDKIFLDYAGFRTLDSVVRAHAVFNEDEFIIISQPFHNERALFIAQHKEISAKAYNARSVGSRYGFKTKLREKFARVKTVLDLFILHTNPKFLGPEISIE